MGLIACVAPFIRIHTHV